MDIIFLRNTSALELIDVTLDDPAEGTLVTKFREVHFKNVFVKRCKCGLVEYLFRTPDEIASRLVKNLSNLDNGVAISRVKMEIDLSRHIKCHPQDGNNAWVHPSESCKKEIKEIIIEKEVENWDSKSIIGISVSLFIISSLVTFLVIYLSRQKEKKKRELVKNWQFHDPEELRIEDDSKHYICYISPSDENSTIFSTANVEMRESHQRISHKGPVHDAFHAFNSTNSRNGYRSCLLSVMSSVR